MAKLIEKINEHMNFELESAYVYLGMVKYLDEQDMGGFSHFMKKQAQEEFEHFEKFYNFLFELDEIPVLEGLKKPEQEFKNFTDVFKIALEHEKEVTKRIHDLYEAAVKDKNRDVQNFLEWFIEEQREEENTFRGIVTRLERIGESWSGLYIFNRELGQR